MVDMVPQSYRGAMSAPNTSLRTHLSRTARGRPTSDRPTSQKRWIRRRRLEAQLESAVRSGLTVVTGPPGAGKTVLLEQWVRARCTITNNVTQLPLSADDNDPQRFWRRVSSAFLSPNDRWRSCFVLDDEEATRPHRTAAHTLLACLIDLVPTIVVLDDYHVIYNPELIASFAWFVCNLPPHIHVVVAGRDDSHLPLQRLRPNGQLAEIRGSDLRFTTEETLELFTLNCAQGVDADGVNAFIQRADGWAAGLGLVASQLADLVGVQETIRLLEDGHLTDDYFSREVLDSLSTEDVSFLLTISVLDRVTGELCQELTGREDAAGILESLARRNLFVSKLDSVGRWYCLHPLFASFLRRRLQRHDPTAARRAQTTAASWSHKHGDVRAAMRYQAEAGAHNEAFVLGVSALVQRAALGVRLPTEAPHLPSGLTKAYLGADIYRSYITAAELLYSGRCAKGAEWLRYLEPFIVADPNRLVWRRRIECLWALHDALRGEAFGALQHCRQAAPLDAHENDGLSIDTEEDRGAAEAGLAPINALVSDTLSVVAARALLTLDQPVAARADIAPQLEDVRALASIPHIAVSALLASAEGRLSDATTLARRALDVANFTHRAETLAALDAHLALAISYWERHQLDAAADELEGVLQPQRSALQMPVFWPLERQMIRVMVSQGRVSEALRRISILRREQGQEIHSWQHSAQLNEQESRCCLLLGDLERARQALNPSHNSPRILALIDLYSNDPDRAVARLADPLASIPHLAAELERLTLMARAKLRLGREREALSIIRRAIELGRPDGFVRPFVGYSTELLPLLQRILGGLPDNYLEKVIAQTEQSALADITQQGSDVAGHLSIREQEILAYLSSYRSLGEIANELYISLNTVKSHVQDIYRKLGAHTRSQAVSTARAQKLLRP
jgi:LuxR family maltose regulon positive regulatory protein